jgi:hypothetical protein
MQKILFLLFVLPSYSFGQGLFLPDGTATKDSLSINQMVKTYYPGSKSNTFSYSWDNKIESQLTGIEALIYETLTGKPLLVYASKPPAVKDISKVTDSYKMKYYKSLYFIEDIRRLIKDGEADTSYIARTLGKPTIQNDSWLYPQHKLKLTITGGHATDFVSENYAYNIKLRKDEFTGKKSYSIPSSKKFVLVKNISKGVSYYFCEIYGEDETTSYDSEESIFFLFTDGTSLKLDAEAIRSGPKPFGRLFIESKYTPVFTTKLIKAVRLGDSSVVAFTPQEAKDFLGYMKALNIKK